MGFDLNVNRIRWLLSGRQNMGRELPGGQRQVAAIVQEAAEQDGGGVSKEQWSALGFLLEAYFTMMEEAQGLLGLYNTSPLPIFRKRVTRGPELEGPLGMIPGPVPRRSPERPND